MSVMTWLRGITAQAVDTVRTVPDPTSGAPWPPHIAQQARILRRAEQYRQQFRAEAAARAAAEAQQERDRLERARREFEDEAAFGLAMGAGYFPQDRHGPGPGVLSIEAWRSHHNVDIYERPER